jgi:hypothetical protein
MDVRAGPPIENRRGVLSRKVGVYAKELRLEGIDSYGIGKKIGGTIIVHPLFDSELNLSLD